MAAEIVQPNNLYQNIQIYILLKSKVLMFCRITLAALHFNENGMRDQAVTKAGNKRYSIVFPKFKKGGYTVREVKVDCTYGKY